MVQLRAAHNDVDSGADNVVQSMVGNVAGLQGMQQWLLLNIPPSLGTVLGMQ